MNACKIFLDTNVLVYHTFEDFDVEKHTIAASTLRQLHGSQCPLYISPQIIREFAAIATNGKIFQTPLNTDAVLLKVNEFQHAFQMLFNTPETLEQLKVLIRQYQISKQDVHDANIAAMVIAHQLDYVWTFNRKDFERFSQIQLLDVPLNPSE